MKEEGKTVLDQQVPVKRASATREELYARQQHISKHPVERLTTPPQQRNRKTIEDQRVGSTPASQIRYRSLNTEYVIHMSDGSQLHVTERELLTLPPEYKDAAIPLNAAPTPQLLPIPPASPVPQVHTDDLPRQ